MESHEVMLPQYMLNKDHKANLHFVWSGDIDNIPMTALLVLRQHMLSSDLNIILHVDDPVRNNATKARFALMRRLNDPETFLPAEQEIYGTSAGSFTSFIEEKGLDTKKLTVSHINSPDFFKQMEEHFKPMSQNAEKVIRRLKAIYEAETTPAYKANIRKSLLTAMHNDDAGNIVSDLSFLPAVYLDDPINTEKLQSIYDKEMESERRFREYKGNYEACGKHYTVIGQNGFGNGCINYGYGKDFKALESYVNDLDRFPSELCMFIEWKMRYGKKKKKQRPAAKELKYKVNIDQELKSLLSKDLPNIKELESLLLADLVEENSKTKTNEGITEMVAKLKSSLEFYINTSIVETVENATENQSVSPEELKAKLKNSKEFLLELDNIIKETQAIKIENPSRPLLYILRDRFLKYIKGDVRDIRELGPLFETVLKAGDNAYAGFNKHKGSLCETVKLSDMLYDSGPLRMHTWLPDKDRKERNNHNDNTLKTINKTLIQKYKPKKADKTNEKDTPEVAQYNTEDLISREEVKRC